MTRSRLKNRFNENSSAKNGTAIKIKVISA